MYIIGQKQNSSMIKLFVTHNLGIGKQWFFVEPVATLCIAIAANTEPVQKKVKVQFSGAVQNLLIPRKPAKCLFTGHCIGLWVLCFQKI